MSILDNLVAWMKENPPKTMPFYPKAQCTGRVGLRSSREVLDAGASPLHLGVDRTAGTGLVMPFDGRLWWRRTGGVAGSVLTLKPKGLCMEIQVFHTDAGREVDEISEALHRGDPLPVRPASLGLSSGVHTHTEVLFPNDKELRVWATEGIPAIITEGAVNQHLLPAIRMHCDKHDLNYEEFLRATKTQVKRWCIEEFWPRAAVRRVLPTYREPDWMGSTLIVDSLWLLKI